jgi:hypothetical protein
VTVDQLQARIAELEARLSGRTAPTSADVLVLPRQLTWVAAMDWGHNAPGCIGWAAVWDGPSGPRMHVLREWKFTDLEDELIADGYKKRTRELGIQPIYVAGDPSMWIRDGRNASRGQSRAETLIRSGMPLRKAENARPDGWSRLHSWLRIPTNDESLVIGEPMLTIDETCKYLIRTIPAQRSDKTDAEDVDTKGDDHGVDMLRYLVMSRPMPIARARQEKKLNPMLEEALAASSAREPLGSQNVRSRHA